MAEGKRRSWIKWVIWTPCVLALLGVGLLLYADHSIDAQILKEEQRLLGMGIDVRKFAPEMAAGPEYEAIAKSYLPLSKEKEGEFLDRLEAASKKPLLNAPNEANPEEKPGLRKVLAELEAIKERALKAHDWPTYEQVDKIWVGELAQVITGGEFSRFALPSLVDLPEWCKDPQARDQVRRRLLSADTKRLILGKLTGYGRSMLKANYDNSKVTNPSMPFWQKALDSQTTFRKGGELAILRQLRLTAEMVLKMETLKGLSLDLPMTIADGLQHEGTLQAHSARERAMSADYPQFQSFTIFRVRLIQIDLCESREKGKPLVPTWSKPYCYDPQLNIEIKVTANNKECTLSTPRPDGTSGWNTRFKW